MRVAVVLFALLISACGGVSEAPPPTREAVRLPQKLCDGAKAALDALSSKGALDYDASGAATITQDVWFQLPAAQREALAEALGRHASCSAAAPLLEQEVTITGDTGTPLMRRVIDLSYDPAELMSEEGSG